MIRCVIVDDETSGRILLRKLLENFDSIEVVGEASSVASAISEIDTKRPDLVFLDVRMPDGNGFEVLKSVTYKKFHLIFTTAHDAYALQAIKEQAIDYIIKPIDFAELKRAVDQVEKRMEPKALNVSIDKLGESLKRLSANFAKVPISTMNGVEFIPSSEIIRCTAESNYTRIYLRNHTSILSAKTLKEYQNLLDKTVFFRVHKSHIVNINCVVKYMRSGFLLLEDNSTVEIAKKIKDDFLTQLLGK